VKQNLPVADKKILLGDNLASHKTPEVQILCDQWNIK